MRRITGQDIIDFYDDGVDLLVLGIDYEFTPLSEDAVQPDPEAHNKDLVTTDDGHQVQILIRRTDIIDGDWFPDAVDDDGQLIPSVADEMADLVNSDGGLDLIIAVQEAREASTEWEQAAAEANRLAGERAARVARVVDAFGGNQSQAGRALKMDQSTVNKLVKKAKALQ